MKKLLLGILCVSIFFLFLFGCGNAYVINDKSESDLINDKSESELKNYITNYDEVLDIIYDQFGEDAIITDYTGYSDEEQFLIDKDKATVKQFGNGSWSLSVNDIRVSVETKDHTATEIVYYNGITYVHTNTQTKETETRDTMGVSNKAIDTINTEVNTILP